MPLPRPFSALALCALATSPALFSQPAPDTIHTAAQVRATLAAKRAQVATHRKDSHAIIDLAYTLMDAGLAEEAIEEGRQAILAEPKSAFAWNAYAWLLHHNAIGVDYGKGYDRQATTAAYEHAVPLNPLDPNFRKQFADSLEYDLEGVRYGPTSDVPRAIEVLRFIQDHQHPVDPDITSNLALDLFRVGRYQESLSEAEQQEPAPALDAVEVAATAVLKDVPSAIAVSEAFGNDTRRSSSLRMAFEALCIARRYPEAAAILSAWEKDRTPKSNELQQIQIMRTLKPYTDPASLPEDPRTTVRQLFAGLFQQTMPESAMSALFSNHAHPLQDGSKFSETGMMQISGLLQNFSLQSGMPPYVASDILLGNLRLQVEPTTTPGTAQVNLQVIGTFRFRLFLVQEDHTWRIVADSNEFTSIGEEALYLVNNGQPQQAAALLDWKRSIVKTNTDDPLGGVLFARFWSPQSSSSQSSQPDAIRIAAASLMTGSPTAANLLPQLTTLRDHADDTHRDLLTLLLAYIEIAQGHDQAEAASADATLLLAHHPDSITALRLAGQSFQLTGKFDDWKAALTPRLAANPHDPDLLRQQAAFQLAQSAFADARHTYRTLLDSGTGTPADQNEYGWLNLFTGTVDADAIAEAEQASGNKAFAELHTLACLYAAHGDVETARETLLRAMTSGHMVEPDERIWLGFGLIYEQDGETDAAIQALKRVTKPKNDTTTTSSYALAQLHLKRLEGKK